MSPERMGGFVPNEEIKNEEEGGGILSKLGKKLGKTGKALGVAGALLAASPEISEAKERYNEPTLAEKANKEQSELEGSIEKDKEMRDRIEKYKAKVVKYYPQHAEMMNMYFNDIVTEVDGRLRPMEHLEVIVPAYEKQLDKNIENDFGSKGSKNKKPTGK